MAKTTATATTTPAKTPSKGPITRQQKTEDALQHVLTVVLYKNQTQHPEYFHWIKYSNITSMSDILDVSIDDMKTTQYSNDGNMQLPSLSLVGSIRLLQGYSQFFKAKTTKWMDNDAWLDMTFADYNEFRSTNTLYAPIQPNPSATTSGSHTKTVDLVADFKKGVKRDATQFAKLKDDSQWDNWNRDIITTARAQNVEDVLDSSYRPANLVDVALFKEQQKFMYDVFVKSCLTDMTKNIVRNHFDDGDAQKVYSELKDHFTKSTKAKQDAGTLLTYLTSANIVDGKWTGTTQGFILNWQNKLRIYNELKPIGDKLTETLKLSLIQNAVDGLQPFQTVKENEDNSFSRTGVNLAYGPYSDLLLSAAVNYDIHTSPKKGPKSSTRGVYSTNITDDHGNDDVLNIDSSIDMIQANFSRTASMPKTRWDNLTPEVKTLWDTLDEDSKAIILGNVDPKTKLPIAKTSDNRRSSNRSSNRDTRTRSTNQHDIIRAFLANVQPDTDEEDDDNAEATEVDTECLDQFTKALLAFNASQTTSEKSKASSPADIRSVLSQPSKKSALKKATFTNTQVEVNEVVFNGSTYRLVKD